MTTRAKVREAARSQATRSGRVPQSTIDKQLKAFDDKDLRLRSVGILPYYILQQGARVWDCQDEH